MPARFRRLIRSIALLLTVGAMFAQPALTAEVTDELAALFDGTVLDRYVPTESGWLRLYEGVEAGGSDITQRTQVQLHNVSSPVMDSVYLAGLGSEADGGTVDVALEWAPSGTASWFGPRWTLKLRSDKGLLIRGDQRVAEITLSNAPPVAGHTYETYLSYNADADTLAVSVVDLTNGQSVYEGEVQLAPPQDVYYPIAGVKVKGPAGDAALDAVDELDRTLSELVTFVHVASAPVYVPVGSRLTVGTRREDGSVLQVQRFASDERVSLLIPGTSAVGGRFEVYSEGVDGTVTLIAQNEDTTATVVDLPASDLPWGTSQLQMRYVSPTEDVWLTDSVELTVGSVTAVVSTLQVDANAKVLQGSVRFVTDAGRLHADLIVEAVLTRLEWDFGMRRYREVQSLRISVLDGTFDLSDPEWEIPFRIPFPQPEQPGLWRVALQPRVDIDHPVPVQISNTSERLFSTYQAAQNLDTLPFTIAVLPDTQNYPKAYPEILTRQAEWIAANAEALNIGAVLHVGDIVDNNEVIQWQRAANSLHALDGVVPYVLAVGNHDVRVAFTPERSLFDRDGSLINQFFTIDNARAHSNLGGTFTPGRLENSYSIFTFGGEKYLVLSLEWGPRDEVLSWADEVLAAHADHKVIIITHAFTAPDGGWVTTDRYPVALPSPGDFVPEPSTVNSAADIWERLIHRHANVLMVLSGHMGFHGNAHNARIGAQGNRVFEIGTNYQSDPNGGNGWLLLLTFTPDERLIVEAFSPYLCEHRYDFGWFYHSFWFDMKTGISRPLDAWRNLCAGQPHDPFADSSTVSKEAGGKLGAMEQVEGDYAKGAALEAGA